jgi:hypothetical protein
VTLPRLHLFEHNDTEIVPRALRETVIESLGRTLAWGRILRPLAPTFAQFISETGADGVLDLCSGVGTPAAIMVTEMEKQGQRAPSFLLTDLQPQVEAWTELRKAHPNVIDFVAEPLDATRIPEALGKNRVRVIINAFHHFRPELAAAILQGACKDAPGVFIAEGFERSPLGFASFALAGLPALYANPFLAPHRNVQKALLTYATPIALAVSAWDGLVSTMRVYTESELRKMVEPLGEAFEWTYGTYDFFPGGRGYFFKGVRRHD